MPKIRPLAAGIAALALVGGLTTTAHASGSPTPEITPSTIRAAEVKRGIMLDAGPILKKKYGFKEEWLGPIETGGVLGDCYDYGKLGPDGKTWKTGSIADVADQTVRERMQWVSNAYWDKGLKDWKISAARKATENRLRSAEFRSDWAKSYVAQLRGTGVAEISDRMLAEAKRNAGPVTLKVAFDSQPTPGVTGTATATALGNGKPYAGQTVTWTVTNATWTPRTKTNEDGKTSVKFVPDGTGKVRATAVLASPEWRRATYSIPSTTRRQHLLRAADKNTVETKAFAEYDTKFGTTVTQDCGSECEGRPPVTFTAKAGANPVQWRASASGKVLGSLNLAAGRSGSETFTGTDGQTITFAYRVKVGKQWSGWRTAKTFDVVCPAWPGITPVLICVCKGGTKGGYEFAAPGGPRFYLVRLTIGGQVLEKSITGTQTVTLTGPITSGDHVTAEFDAYADAEHTKRLAGGKLHGFTED